MLLYFIIIITFQIGLIMNLIDQLISAFQADGGNRSEI